MQHTIKRKKTRQIKLGNLLIGGDAPISVQSMTNTDTSDIDATVQQIKELTEVGCEIVRVAVPDLQAAHAIKEICNQSLVPIIADIHFDYRLALESIKNNVAGIRLNPGNIGSEEKTEAVIKSAKEREIPIRIGVNAGSISKALLKKHGGATIDAMVESALEHIAIVERYHYHNIKVSLKASDIYRTVEAYRSMAKKVDYPLHIGVSEAGTYFSGTVKSSIGLGILLYEGIGDTLRVSLTGDPLEEVRVAYELLKSLGIRQKGINYISCPTCGRCEINLVEMANKVEQATAKIDKKITVAIMGCVVNGPGEAREADIGIAGGDGTALLFKDGEVIRKVSEEEMLQALLEEIENYAVSKQ
ncbi:MAG: flavodoxin-dependent (E)-4-hydroxy-3-methylbut-2-enyl-diphosphate synthase [Nitrospinae bacterium]|nr:flavodoxin-dependent (E)-4-hydroxy-3-methylbut-2-enyl-diphosphate synthase [Nitrospinota bacterium]